MVDSIVDLTDNTYYDTENDCLLLDDGINVCDEIQEFVKVFSLPKDSIKGQVFLNCWSLLLVLINWMMRQQTLIPTINPCMPCL